jgi:hypothetical protein
MSSYRRGCSSAKWQSHGSVHAALPLDRLHFARRRPGEHQSIKPTLDDGCQQVVDAREIEAHRRRRDANLTRDAAQGEPAYALRLHGCHCYRQQVLPPAIALAAPVGPACG